MTKMKNTLKEKDVGAIGIGAMIVFIAMVLVAGIAASVLISTSTNLEMQALKTGQENIAEVASGLRVESIEGFNKYFFLFNLNFWKYFLKVLPAFPTNGAGSGTFATSSLPGFSATNTTSTFDKSALEFVSRIQEGVSKREQTEQLANEFFIEIKLLYLQFYYLLPNKK